MNTLGQNPIKRDLTDTSDHHTAPIDQKITSREPSRLPDGKDLAPPFFMMADFIVQKVSQGKVNLGLLSNPQDLKRQLSELYKSPEGRLSIKISSTEELIKIALDRLDNKTLLQGITDSIGGPGVEGQIRSIAKLNLADQNLRKAKEFFSQGNFTQAVRYERLAYNAAQEFHGDYSDYSSESLNHGETVAKVVKTTGDTLFALGVTGALAAIALPGAIAMSAKGLGGAVLGYGLFVTGEGSALALTGTAKRGFFTLIGGEENALDNAFMWRDFNEGVNLGSFQFFAPFAGALGQTWAEKSTGIAKLVKELLPIALLQSSHGAAQAVTEGGSVKEAALAALMGFGMPYLFHGAEKGISALQNRGGKGVGLELYDGVRAAQGTPKEDAIRLAQEKFGLNDQEIKNIEIVNKKFKETVRKQHSDFNGNKTGDQTAELAALRNILLRDVCGVKVSPAQSQLADAYLAGKIEPFPNVPPQTQATPAPKLPASNPTMVKAQSKIELVDLSNNPRAVSKMPKNTDVAPAPQWKIKPLISEKAKQLAAQIFPRGGNSSTPTQAELNANHPLSGNGEWKNSSKKALEIRASESNSDHPTPKQLRAEVELTSDIASGLHDAWRAPRRKPDGTYDPRIKTTKDSQWIQKNGGKTEVDIANTAYEGLPSDWQAENKASAQVAAYLVLDAAKKGNPLNGDFIEKASAIIHDKWLERNGAWAPLEQKKPYAGLSEAEKEKDRVIVRKAIELCFSPSLRKGLHGSPRASALVFQETAEAEYQKLKIESERPLLDPDLMEESIENLEMKAREYEMDAGYGGPSEEKLLEWAQAIRLKVARLVALEETMGLSRNEIENKISQYREKAVQEMQDNYKNDAFEYRAKAEALEEYLKTQP